MTIQLYGLVFDVDGLIANTEPLNARVTIRVFEDLFGVRGMRPEDFAAGIGKGAEAFVRAGAVAQGISLTDEQVTAGAHLREEYLIRALREEGVPAFPGVLELIDAALRNPGFRLAIATSASGDLARAMLDSTRVPYQRMTCVYGDQVKHRKPDPEIFLTAIRRMDIPPARCVVFEDAPAGVAAARAAGIGVVVGIGSQDLSEATVVVPSLAHVRWADGVLTVS